MARQFAREGNAACGAAQAGVDGEAFVALVSDAQLKAGPVSSTEEAVSRGVFGTPTCFVGEQMFL